MSRAAFLCGLFLVTSCAVRHMPPAEPPVAPAELQSVPIFVDVGMMSINHVVGTDDPSQSAARDALARTLELAGCTVVQDKSQAELELIPQGTLQIYIG